MPHTFTQLHYHIVFSTKNREPSLIPEIRERMWDYLGGIVLGEGGLIHRIGGMADHVHLLATFRQTKTVANTMRTIKAVSSGWASKTFPNQPLRWQIGYAAFSVSHSALKVVADYIRDQEEHHRSRSYQDELRLLLHRHGLEPDEQYMWT